MTTVIVTFIRQHMPWRHLSTSVISQLLLTQFWPNVLDLNISNILAVTSSFNFFGASVFLDQNKNIFFLQIFFDQKFQAFFDQIFFCQNPNLSSTQQLGLTRKWLNNHHQPQTQCQKYCQNPNLTSTQQLGFTWKWLYNHPPTTTTTHTNLMSEISQPWLTQF